MLAFVLKARWTSASYGFLKVGGSHSLLTAQYSISHYFIASTRCWLSITKDSVFLKKLGLFTLSSWPCSYFLFFAWR